MKTFLKASALALAASTATVAISAPAHAQSGPILTVNVDQVLSDSVAGKSATSQMQAKYNGRLQAARTAIQTSGSAFQAQIDAAKKVAKPDGTVPPATQETLEKAQAAYNNAQREEQALSQEVNYVAQYVRGQILQKMSPIVEKIRADRKAAVVLAENSTLASDPAGDVTKQAMAQLDATFTTPTIVPPQQTAPAASAAPAATAPKSSGR